MIDKEEQRARWRKDASNKRAKKIALGLCLECMEPVSTPGGLCPIHKLKHSQSVKKYKQKRLEEQNRCYTCGRPLINTEGKNCKLCTAYKWENKGWS